MKKIKEYIKFKTLNFALNMKNKEKSLRSKIEEQRQILDNIKNKR